MINIPLIGIYLMRESYVIQAFLSNLPPEQCHNFLNYVEELMKASQDDIFQDHMINQKTQTSKNNLTNFLQSLVDYQIDPTIPRVIWEVELPPSQRHNGMKISVYDDGSLLQTTKPIKSVDHIDLNLRITRDVVSFKPINRGT